VPEHLSKCNNEIYSQKIKISFSGVCREIFQLLLRILPKSSAEMLVALNALGINNKITKNNLKKFILYSELIKLKQNCIIVAY